MVLKLLPLILTLGVPAVGARSGATNGTVFETPDGVRFVVRAAKTQLHRLRIDPRRLMSKLLHVLNV